MSPVTLHEYQNMVKQTRAALFPSPFELVYTQFLKLGLDQRDESYFAAHASEIMEELRTQSWDAFVPLEREFTSNMLQKLVHAEDVVEMGAVEAITWIFNQYPEHIYQLSLSNTQSRRSRAGKEFEAIIELILLGAGIPLDSQGNIGKAFFVEKGLGKLVDVVSPGVVEYTKNKRMARLISAKTSLRERWQEVPEELGRTGAGEMFLVTLDSAASDQVLAQLYEQNIQLVTTRDVKDRAYQGNERVLTFEDMILELQKNFASWERISYSASEIATVRDLIETQLRKHVKHEFVYQKYLARKAALSRKESSQKKE